MPTTRKDKRGQASRQKSHNNGQHQTLHLNVPKKLIRILDKQAQQMGRSTHKHAALLLGAAVQTGLGDRPDLVALVERKLN